MAGNFKGKPLDGILPDSKQTLHTVAAGTRLIIKAVTLVNTDDNNPVTINLYVKPNAASRRIFPKDYQIAAKQHAFFNTYIPLEAGDLIEGDASLPGVVDYVIGLIEET